MPPSAPRADRGHRRGSSRPGRGTSRPRGGSHGGASSASLRNARSGMKNANTPPARVSTVGAVVPMLPPASVSSPSWREPEQRADRQQDLGAEVDGERTVHDREVAAGLCSNFQPRTADSASSREPMLSRARSMPARVRASLGGTGSTIAARRGGPRRTGPTSPPLQVAGWMNTSHQQEQPEAGERAGEHDSDHRPGTPTTTSSRSDPRRWLCTRKRSGTSTPGQPPQPEDPEREQQRSTPTRTSWPAARVVRLR